MHLCRPRAVSNQQDIIIIGAGLIGLCTADALAERGGNSAGPAGCRGCYGSSGRAIETNFNGKDEALWAAGAPCWVPSTLY